MRIRTLIVIALLYATPGLAVSVTGRVRIVGRVGAGTPVVVYAEALDAKPTIPSARFSMSQRNKSFAPHVLAIPVGSTVDFPNEDLIFHNVFSLSRPAPFDLGLYRGSVSKNRVFSAPAVYRVFCNIHPQMAGIILVVPTPYITETDAMGGYRLDLPAGRYRITAWSERAEVSVVESVITATTANAPELMLDESRFADSGHKNKLGQDYPKSAYDPTK